MIKIPSLADKFESLQKGTLVTQADIPCLIELSGINERYTRKQVDDLLAPILEGLADRYTKDEILEFLVDLEERISEGLADRYTKEAIDDFVDVVLDGLADVYPKHEIDLLFAECDTDLADRYTKSEVNEIRDSLQTAIDARCLSSDVAEMVTGLDNALNERYAKHDVDLMIETLQAGLDDRYTKAETDLYNEAFSTVCSANFDNRYTKSEVDAFIQNLANFCNTNFDNRYTKEETYTKDETDAHIFANLPSVFKGLLNEGGSISNGIIRLTLGTGTLVSVTLSIEAPYNISYNSVHSCFLVHYNATDAQFLNVTGTGNQSMQIDNDLGYGTKKNMYKGTVVILTGTPANDKLIEVVISQISEPGATDIKTWVMMRTYG